MASFNLAPAAGITGLGYYVPDRVLTNQDLEQFVDTSDDWIYSRTGIRERHIAAGDESTAELASRAARLAMADARVTEAEIDLILVATCTPDFQFPSTAALLQDRLGCTCPAFDVGAACSGFGYALVVAQQFIATGACQTVLVVGAEVMSRILDWSDRTTCVLFGDGAGAAIVRPVAAGFGLTAWDLGSDGSGGDLLRVDLTGQAVQSTTVGTGGESVPGPGLGAPASMAARQVVQNGREVYRFAVKVMGDSVARAMAKCGVTNADLNLLVPHQANVRIIEAAARRLDLPLTKVFMNVEKYGNTSAASIPIALCEARDQGLIRSGDTIATVGFGAGLTWASSIIKWI